MVLIKKIHSGKGPEKKIQEDLIKYLRMRDWFVRPTHGGSYQAGVPDLYAVKRRYGARWIEMKNVVNYRFTDDQMRVFPQFSKNGVGIWVLQGATDDDYNRLFGAPNWASYLPVAQVYTRNRTRKEVIRAPLKKAGSGPEMVIQEKIIKALEADGWYCLTMAGCLFQSGFPDIFVCKKGCGTRWVEVKNPAGYQFTGAQLETFPRMMAEGVGIWILTSETQIDRLNGKPNWTEYLK
jgi:hypothetical protein